MNLSKLVSSYVDMCEKSGTDDVRFVALKAMYKQYGVELTDQFISEELDHRNYMDELTLNHDAIAHQEDLNRE